MPEGRYDAAIGTGNQLFNISKNGTLRNRGAPGSPGSCLGRPVARSAGGAPMTKVVQGFGPHQYCDQSWGITPVAGHPAGVVQLSYGQSPGMCLTADGGYLAAEEDPWCAANNNMWRSSTDTLQVWSRVMVQQESLVGLGAISGPGQRSHGR